MTDFARASPERVPESVASNELRALAEGHHSRSVRPLWTRDLSGHLVKAYAIEAPGRAVSEREEHAAQALAAGHLASGRARGSLGLAVLLVHAGGDGDYVLVHTWIEGYMSDLAVFVGPPGEPDRLRPGRQGLAPCVWEQAVLAHERDAFSTHVLGGDADLGRRLSAWGGDVVRAAVR
ncbi:hypothetical protein [Streptomonospora wellingtoniae]|uniref:Uncharacterized protein n=1 Tax=Streptomonospora wellingtoniae TaxID=3075544 RepID=A0ABU2KVY7_9ACTN|nr:hypothetical protein [Streptomonospora sp. DSM 45055]MDT0303452.1 hypothetical protein [Streptomonospora sp. DSM 45055]